MLKKYWKNKNQILYNLSKILKKDPKLLKITLTSSKLKKNNIKSLYFRDRQNNLNWINSIYFIKNILMKLIIRKLKILKKYSYPYLVFQKLKIIERNSAIFSSSLYEAFIKNFSKSNLLAICFSKL